jgi:hypothetical protein
MRSIIPLAILCILLSLFLGCHKETEQDKVKRVITNIQKAAEEKDSKKISGSISRTYNDLQGNNYASINRLVIAYFYQFPKISIYITRLNVSVNDVSAKATFQAVLTSKGNTESQPAVLPESLGVYEFNVVLKK